MHFAYHGISSGLSHMGGTEWLKRELLLYDKIGLIYLEPCKAQLRMYSDVKAGRADTYEYLQDQGVLYEADIPVTSTNSDVLSYLRYAEEANERFEHEHPSDPVKYAESAREGRRPNEISTTHYYDMQAHLCRAVAIESAGVADTITVPMFNPRALAEKAPFQRSTIVLQAVIRDFPVPGDLVSFEDILQLRVEPEFVRKRNALRAWVRKLARENWSDADITQELRYLLDEYGGYMRVMRLKHTKTTLSAFVKAGAGFIENIAKLKLAKVAESACSILSENINLAEAEINAPGREVAYIAALNSRLSDSVLL
jgi:hypothetical protein